MSSPRVCYVERSDRGVRLRRARLAGLRAEEMWTPVSGVSDTEGDPIGRVSALAAWLRDRLAGSRGGPALDVLCVDADASACAWMGAPSYDARVVDAVLRQRTEHGGDGEGSQPSAIATLTTVLGDRAEVGVQAIATTTAPARRVRSGVRRGETGRPGAQGSGVRVPVLAIPDATVRVLTDELDRLGVRLGSVMSVWHAIALAWDAGWSRVQPDKNVEDRIVSESVSTQATVIVDAESGRVLWAWSRAGGLLAAGSMLVPTEVVEDRARVSLNAGHAARLATEFLSWGVQTGAAPARTIVVAPESESVGAFGQALAEAMPNTTVDVAIDSDPIGTTMRRLAERIDVRAPDNDDPRSVLVALGARPSRAHRSMYRWAAVAVCLLALCITIAGWRTGQATAQVRAAASQARASASEAVAKVRPAIAGSPFMAVDLETELLTAQRQSMPPDAFQPARPIVRELEGLSFLLAMPTLTLEDIDLTQVNGRVTFFVPDTAMAQEIEAACRDLDGLSMLWKAEIRTVDGSSDRRVRCSLTGVWPARSASAGSSP
jgi:hypothetical protein